MWATRRSRYRTPASSCSVTSSACRQSPVLGAARRRVRPRAARRAARARLQDPPRGEPAGAGAEGGASGPAREGAAETCPRRAGSRPGASRSSLPAAAGTAAPPGSPPAAYLRHRPLQHGGPREAGRRLAQQPQQPGAGAGHGRRPAQAVGHGVVAACGKGGGHGIARPPRARGRCVHSGATGSPAQAACCRDPGPGGNRVPAGGMSGRSGEEAIPGQGGVLRETEEETQTGGDAA